MERSLATFLRSLQYSSQDSDAARLLPIATSLLLSLHNPLNITLLASQLLSVPSLWNEIHDLRGCRRIFSVFYNAALQLSLESSADLKHVSKPVPLVGREKWTTAVVKGADDRSPRWRHVLMLGAILLGFEEKQKLSLPVHLRSRLESAVVAATNLALQTHDREGDNIAKFALAFVLNHTFELLADYNQARLNHDLMLPILVEATFSSKEGLELGYWLAAIDQDVTEVTNRKFNWSPRSNTFRCLQEMQERPLVASLGPMCRLIAYSLGNVRDSGLLLSTVDRIADFARSISVSWRQNKLSEIDVSEESDFLDDESTKATLPTLWHILRLSLFSTVVIMRPVMARLLSDSTLASDLKAPSLAMQCLHSLRYLYFIAYRLGQTSSSQFVFVNMLAIDVLTQYPGPAEIFIRSISPAEHGQIPVHPADRSHDLFFFNTAEHFTLTLSPKANEELLLAAAMPYLTAGGSKALVVIFEAAHSVALCILAAPHNANLAARTLPFYMDTLFECFPETLSARQFRLAFKTLVRISSPPSPLAQSQPLLSSILLETIYDRARQAPTNTLPEAASQPQNTDQNTSLSEQAVFVMAIIDCLCFLHPLLLEEWLSLTASLVAGLDDMTTRRACQDRFWEAMTSGGMDAERATLCVGWWSSRGGREQVLQSGEALQKDLVRSGALPIGSKL